MNNSCLTRRRLNSIPTSRSDLVLTHRSATPTGIGPYNQPHNVRACMQALMSLGRTHFTASSRPHPNPPPRQRIEPDLHQRQHMVERFFRDITDKRIRRDSFTSVAELERPLVVSCGTQQSKSLIVVEPGGHVGRLPLSLSTCPPGSKRESGFER